MTELPPPIPPAHIPSLWPLVLLWAAVTALVFIALAVGISHGGDEE